MKLANKRDAMILDHVNARDDQLSQEDACVLCKVTPSKGCPSWPSLNSTILMINAFGTHEMTDLSVYQYLIALTAMKSDD